MAARWKFAGVEYPVPDSFTFGEARTIKRLTGMTLAEADKQFITDGSDPDCTFALFLVSVQRVRPNVTQAELEDVDMSDVELEIDPPAKNGDAPTPTEAGGGGT